MSEVYEDLLMRSEIYLNDKNVKFITTSSEYYTSFKFKIGHLNVDLCVWKWRTSDKISVVFSKTFLQDAAVGNNSVWTFTDEDKSFIDFLNDNFEKIPNIESKLNIVVENLKATKVVFDDIGIDISDIMFKDLLPSSGN